MDIKEQNLPDNNLESEQIVLNLDPNQPKKKMKKWPFVAGAILLAVVVLLIALWDPIVSLFHQEEKQNTIKDYEAQAFGQLTDGFVKTYSSILASDKTSAIGTKCHVEVDIEQLALKVIEKEMPDLAILGKLNDLSLDIAVENDGKKYRAYLMADHESADLPGIELQLDPELNRMYLMLPGSTDDYLQFEISDLLDDEKHTNSLLSTSTLPAAEDVEALLDGYFEDLLDLMDEQHPKEDVVKVDKVEQSCTVYTAELQLDEFLKLNLEAIDEFSALLGVESELQEKLNEKINEFEQMMDDEDIPNSMIWTVYVDEDGNPIGRKITIDEEDLFDFLFVTNQDDFAVSMKFAQIELNGSGTIEEDVVNGELILFVNSENYLEIKLKDVMISDYYSGNASGTVELELSDTLSSELFGSDLGLPMEFEVEFKINDQDSEFIISYMDMLSFTIGISQYTPENISLPEGEAIDGSDSDAMYRLLKSIDIIEITNELKKAGLSELFD